MSRIAPPSPYVSWNTFIKDQVVGITDPAARRLLKRDIKLELIASPERHAGNDTTDPRYREYNMYISPGTYSPTVGRPFILSSPYSEHNIVTEQDEDIILVTEDDTVIGSATQLTTTGAQAYSAGASMSTFRVLNRGGNWDEFFANWDNGTWSCVQFPGSVVTNMTNPGDDSPIITITGGTFILDATYSFTGDVPTTGTANLIAE